jgi:hypothetical protein
MTNLADRLFQIVDDTPVYTPVLINLNCFKDLYLLDKSDDKHKYAQHLLFIWYTCDPSSPYFYSDNRIEEAAFEVYGSSEKVITKQLRKCMDEYTKRQSTPMIRAFERAMAITDQNEAILNKNTRQLEEWERLISDCNDLLKTLGKNPEDIATRIELLDRIEDLEAKKLKRQSELSKMIPTINKQVKELLELKKEVDKDRMQINSEDNKDAISNYIVDEFIDKYV